tara:strand:+ start:2926 stop:3753 length:828 start_codon:yes stop_codon:yes gene_type:complete
MYEYHFGLNKKPFSLSPDPEFLYLGENHQRAMTMLQYGVENNAGYTLISGEVGCGKTTLIRYLMSSLDDDYKIGLMSNTHPSFGSTIDLILLAFDVVSAKRSKVEKYRTLEKFLIEQYSLGKKVILIIDEAQNLTTVMLEELRLISNINADKDQVLQVVISGQPEIRALLEKNQLRQFRQRISSDFHLEPLSCDQTGHFIDHRLNISGCQAGRYIFTRRAKRCIHLFAKGTPRLINKYCELCMVYAYADKDETIDWRTVMNVMRDKRNNSSLGIS